MMHQDELGMYDIYTVIHTAFWQKNWFKGMLLILAISGIGFFVWWLVKAYIRSKKQKNVPLKQIVLNTLEQLQRLPLKENVQKVYADLGLIVRLFFTDIHGKDMLSLTEHEIINHMNNCSLCTAHGQSYFKDHCVVCKDNTLPLDKWKERMKQLLERMSDIKYKSEVVVYDELIRNDIHFVTVVTHNVYFKK